MLGALLAFASAAFFGLNNAMVRRGVMNATVLQGLVITVPLGVPLFLAFALAWGVVIWRTIVEFGWEVGVAVAILLPVYLAATIVLFERAVLLWRLVRRWRRRAASAGLDNLVAAHRTAVVEAVLAA